MSEGGMNSTNWLIVIVGLGAALSAGLIGWVVSQSVAEIPEEDRTYLDKLPMFFRALWWPTLWVAYHTGRFIPIATRESLMVKLRLAGLDYVISPEQLIAHRVVVSVVGGLMGLWATTFLAFLPVSTALSIGGGFGFIYTTSWFRDRVLKRKNDMLKTLPFFLDIITLCVEAGLSLTGAFQQAVLKGPEGPLKVEASRVLRDIRAGKPRVDALRAMAERMNDTAITSLVSAMIQAEQLGMNLGPIMRAQADQRRTERFVRAEKAAMEAPVKMLFPLIAFIFPCTFLVLGFPILMKFMQMGF
jgi:tight adherence protein C